MSVLVIGGTGFLGSRIMKRLVDLGEDVVALDLYPSTELLSGYEERIPVIRGDKTDIEQVIALIKQHDVKKIIDLAYILEIESMQNPHKALKVNILGTNNVFEAARLMDIERVLFSSSITAYGSHENFGDKVLDEDDPLYPMTVYGFCKALSEFMARVYRTAHGMDVVVLRVGSAFGPGRTAGATAFVSNITTLPALGQPLFIPLKESTYFVYSSVDDVAQAFVTACRAEPDSLKHPLYNIGGLTHRGDEVARRILELIPDAEISFGDLDVYYVYRVDNSRLREDTGFTLQYDMEEGIKENINEVRRREGLPEVG